MMVPATSELLYQPRAELALIATVLADPRTWTLVDHLPPNAFVDPAREEIWRYFGSRPGAGSLDGLIVHLASRTGGDGRTSLLAGLGGVSGLEGLLVHARSADAAGDLVEIVAECAANRRLRRALQFGSSLLEPGEAPRRAQERIDLLLDELRGIRVGVALDTNELTDGARSWARDFRWRLDNPGKMTGLRLHLRDIDELLLAGLEPGNLTVFASSPGEGKSILVGELARRLVVEKQDDGEVRQVGFFGVEMSGQEMYGRWLSSFTRISADRLRRPESLTKDEKLAIDGAIKQLERDVIPRLFYLGPGKFLTIDDVVRQAKFLVKERGVGILVVDYLQRIGVRSDYGERRDLAIAEVTSKLKSLAAELAVPILAVSQITRESIRERHGRPKLSDLAEGAGIERDADYVVGVWRPARHLENEAAVKTWHNVAVIDLLKGRFRQQSTIYLAFNGETSRFDDLDRDTIRALGSEGAQKLLRPGASSSRAKK